MLWKMTALHSFCCWTCTTLHHYPFIVFSIRSSADGPFTVLPCTRACSCVFHTPISFYWYVHPEVAFLDHTIVLFLIFWGIYILFYTMAILIYIFTDAGWVFRFLFSTSSPAWVIFNLFNNYSSHWVKGYLMVVLIGISLMISCFPAVVMYP